MNEFTFASSQPGQVQEIDQQDETKSDRPWIVIVWNDPINLMSYVTFVFQKLFGYSLEKATELMEGPLFRVVHVSALNLTYTDCTNMGCGRQWNTRRCEKEWSDISAQKRKLQN